MTDKRIATMVETAVVVALALAFSQLRIFRAPQGGSVTLAMVPLLVLTFRRGVRAGAVAGTLFGILRLTLDAYVIHWIQFVLDYPLAFSLLGLAGLFRRRPYLGISVGALGRFACHMASGMVFFASMAPEGTPVAVYSFLYNSTFLVPEAIIAMVVVPSLVRRLPGAGDLSA